MRSTFDPEADAVYIYLKDPIVAGEVTESHICDVEVKEGAIIVNLDRDGRLLGIEILGASKLLPKQAIQGLGSP